MSPTARSVNAVSAAPRWYFGRLSDRRRAPKIALGEHDRAERRDREAGPEVTHDDREPLGPVERRRDGGLELVLAEDLAQVLGLAVVGGDEPRPEALRAPALELDLEPVEAPVELGDGMRIERPLSGAGRRAGRRARRLGHERQLDELAPGEALADRPLPRRFVGRRVEHTRHVNDHRGGGGHVVEQAPAAGGPALQCQRQDGERVQRVAGALGRRIEETDRLDLVAEELDPDGARVARREDVDDAAAHAPLPDFDHRVDALVPAMLEGLKEELAVERVAHRELHHARGEVRGKQELGVERGGRRDHDRRLARGEPLADERALGVRLPLAAAAPETRLALRKLDGRRAEKSQILRPAVRVDDGRDQHERGARVGPEELGDGERTGAAGEADDAQAGGSLGESLREVVKRGPIPQHLEPSRAYQTIDRSSRGRS
jgi:hypothetical protein